MPEPCAFDLFAGVPGPLDVVLRDLHVLWCKDPYHPSHSDPEMAALVLALAVREMTGTPSGRELLERVSDVICAVGADGYFNSRGSNEDEDEDEDEEAIDVDAIDL